MKFVLNLNNSKLLACNSCGNEDFKLLPDKKLSDEEKYKLFLFYECPNCAGAGFWAHSSSIDEKRQVGIAIARCKSPLSAKSDFAVFQLQSC